MNESELCNEALIISSVDVKKCIKCGKCSASCPSFGEMEYHPHQFVDMIAKGRINKLMQSKGIYSCLSCFVCVERCPRDVMPANVIEAVRTIKTRQYGNDAFTPNNAEEILEEDTPQQLLMGAFRKYSR